MTVRYPPIERTALTRLSEGAERSPWPSVLGHREHRPTGLTIDTNLGPRSYSTSTVPSAPGSGQMVTAQVFPLLRTAPWREEGAGAPEAEAPRRGPAKVWDWVRRVFSSKSRQGFKRLVELKPK